MNLSNHLRNQVETKATEFFESIPRDMHSQIAFLMDNLHFVPHLRKLQKDAKSEFGYCAPEIVMSYTKLVCYYIALEDITTIRKQKEYRL
jgi:hypothetical protein